MTTSRIALASLLSLGIAAPATAEPLRQGGKLVLTNGISTIEGASGGGLAAWAVIGGNATKDGIGAQAAAKLAPMATKTGPGPRNQPSACLAATSVLNRRSAPSSTPTCCARAAAKVM